MAIVTRPDIGRLLKVAKEHFQHTHLVGFKSVQELPDFPQQVFEREEKGWKLRARSVNVKWALLVADQKAVDDGQPGDGEH